MLGYTVNGNVKSWGLKYLKHEVVDFKSFLEFENLQNWYQTVQQKPYTFDQSRFSDTLLSWPSLKGGFFQKFYLLDNHESFKRKLGHFLTLNAALKGTDFISVNSDMKYRIQKMKIDFENLVFPDRSFVFSSPQNPEEAFLFNYDSDSNSILVATDTHNYIYSGDYNSFAFELMLSAEAPDIVQFAAKLAIFSMFHQGKRVEHSKLSKFSEWVGYDKADSEHFEISASDFIDPPKEIHAEQLWRDEHYQDLTQRGTRWNMNINLNESI